MSRSGEVGAAAGDDAALAVAGGTAGGSTQLALATDYQAVDEVPSLSFGQKFSDVFTVIFNFFRSERVPTYCEEGAQKQAGDVMAAILQAVRPTQGRPDFGAIVVEFLENFAYLHDNRRGLTPPQSFFFELVTSMVVSQMRTNPAAVLNHMFAHLKTKHEDQWKTHANMLRKVFVDNTWHSFNMREESLVGIARSLLQSQPKYRGDLSAKLLAKLTKDGAPHLRHADRAELRALLGLATEQSFSLTTLLGVIYAAPEGRFTDDMQQAGEDLLTFLGESETAKNRRVVVHYIRQGFHTMAAEYPALFDLVGGVSQASAATSGGGKGSDAADDAAAGAPADVVVYDAAGAAAAERLHVQHEEALFMFLSTIVRLSGGMRSGNLGLPENVTGHLRDQHGALYAQLVAYHLEPDFRAQITMAIDFIGKAKRVVHDKEELREVVRDFDKSFKRYKLELGRQISRNAGVERRFTEGRSIDRLTLERLAYASISQVHGDEPLLQLRLTQVARALVAEVTLTPYDVISGVESIIAAGGGVSALMDVRKKMVTFAGKGSSESDWKKFNKKAKKLGAQASSWFGRKSAKPVVTSVDERMQSGLLGLYDSTCARLKSVVALPYHTVKASIFLGKVGMNIHRVHGTQAGELPAYFRAYDHLTPGYSVNVLQNLQRLLDGDLLSPAASMAVNVLAATFSTQELIGKGAQATVAPWITDWLLYATMAPTFMALLTPIPGEAITNMVIGALHNTKVYAELNQQVAQELTAGLGQVASLAITDANREQLLDGVGPAILDRLKVIIANQLADAHVRADRIDDHYGQFDVQPGECLALTAAVNPRLMDRTAQQSVMLFMGMANAHRSGQEEVAVLKMQVMVRGKLARNQLAVLQASQLQRMAAIAIQAFCRGGMGKAYVANMRKQRQHGVAQTRARAELMKLGGDCRDGLSHKAAEIAQRQAEAQAEALRQQQAQAEATRLLQERVAADKHATALRNWGVLRSRFKDAMPQPPVVVPLPLGTGAAGSGSSPAAGDETTPVTTSAPTQRRRRRAEAATVGCEVSCGPGKCSVM